MTAAAAAAPPRSQQPSHRAKGPGFGLRLVGTALMLLALGFAALDVGVENQMLLAASGIVALVVMQLTGLASTFRTLFLLSAAFLTLRYLSWRVLHTLPPIDDPGFVPGILLFAAEFYGIAMFLLGVFVNLRPLPRAVVPLPQDEALLPSVDVLVPSYNEAPSLLATTLTAAAAMRYPLPKLRIYLLDDGGTDQKCDDLDPALAAAARQRRADLQELCCSLGVEYLTRARNSHAKAGNINAALARTSGDLVLILDADHVPTRDFLENTVGQFLVDPKLFLVQTPHFFVNPDPIERNLRTFEKMPSENEMFYCEGQLGLDLWNAAFFCGSAALLRRTCLEEIGGIQGATITEDAETALALHARGYTSAYIARPMIAGLSPETFAGFVGQRSRWAQGMMQILLLKNPLFRRGLSLAQRLCYLTSAGFWLFPLARMLFMLTPLAYLLFGLRIYNASLDEFLAYAVAHLLAGLLAANFLFGRVRWPFISELYEIAQAPFLAPAVLGVFLRPRSPTFKVTAKAETLAKSFVSELAWPFYLLFALLAVGAATGAWRYAHFPLERDNLMIVLGWNGLNMMFVLAALGVVYERHQRREAPRLRRPFTAEALIGGASLAASVADLSPTGARVLLAEETRFDAQDSRLQLRIAAPHLPAPLTIDAEIRNAVSEDDRVVLGVRFTPRDRHARSELVGLCYGSSQAWIDLQRRRQRRRSIPAGIMFFLSIAIFRGIPGIYAALRERSLMADIRRSLGVRRRVPLRIGGRS